MSAAAPTTTVSSRALLARVAAAFALALGVFGATLAWGGTLHLAHGDAAVVLAMALALSLAFAATRVRNTRGAVKLSFGASLLVGGLVGLAGVGAPEGPVSAWFELGGVVVWLGAAAARAYCALPLMRLLCRDDALATRDALDRVALASSLWFLASLAEMALVVRWMPHRYDGLSGPALGVAMVGLLALTGLGALAVIARSLRWFALWMRVTRGDGWHVHEAATWQRPVPAEPWFHDDAPLDGVVVRRVARDVATYREADLEVAHTRAPLDLARTTRRILRRTMSGIGLFFALAVLTETLVVSLRW